MCSHFFPYKNTFSGSKHHFKLTFCRAYNMKSCTILIIASFAVLLSEACLPPPPPPAGGSETTTAGPTTTAKATTTTKAPDCPMENKMCLAADASNYIEPKTVASSGLCSAECDKVDDCKYWSFIATQTKCLLLKSCDKAADEDGVDSGAKGCVPPTLKFVIVDFHDKAATEGKVVWEKDTVCPTSTFTIDASKTTTVEYTSKCGKLKTIDVKSDAKECDQFKTETDQPIPTFYLKAKADGTADGKCELASNPKILVK